MNGYIVGIWLFILTPVWAGALLLIFKIHELRQNARTPPPKKTEPAGFSVIVVADKSKEKER